MLENGWGLSAVVFLPMVGAGVLLAIPRANEQLHKLVGVAFAGASFLLSVALIFAFDFSNAAEYQFGTDLEWIGVINSNYHIGVDGISLPLLVLSTFITVLAIVYSWEHWPAPHNPKAFLILILVLATGMAGTFVALDLILFFVFFEVVLLPMYFMIGIWGDRNQVTLPVFRRVTEMRLYAAIKFFLFTFFGSALMLLGFLVLYFRSGDGGEERTFDIVELTARSGLFTGHVRVLGVRRPLPGVRREGADVPAAHLAPRRPHRRPDRRVGAAGGHPPEAGHLRVRAHLAADPAR